MADIFLAYARADTSLMVRFCQELESRGLTVWTDESLPVGTQRWREEIQKAIEDARALVVILTPNAKSSSWIAQELAYARTQGIVIYPVLAEGTEKTAVPIDLIDTQRLENLNGAGLILADLLKPDRDRSKDGFYGKSEAQLKRELAAVEERYRKLQAITDELWKRH